MPQERRRQSSTDGMVGRGRDRPDRQALQHEAEERILDRRTGGKYKQLYEQWSNLKQWRNWYAGWHQILEQPMNRDVGVLWEGLLLYLNVEVQKLDLAVGKMRAMALRGDRVSVFVLSLVFSVMLT